MRGFSYAPLPPARPTPRSSPAQVRLLTACAFLSPAELATHADVLRSLAARGRSDDDEWVRIVAASVGDYTGHLDLQAVMDSCPLVGGGGSLVVGWCL